MMGTNNDDLLWEPRDAHLLPASLLDVLRRVHENPNMQCLELSTASSSSSGPLTLWNRHCAESIVQFLICTPRIQTLEVDWTCFTVGAWHVMGSFLKDTKQIQSFCFTCGYSEQATIGNDVNANGSIKLSEHTCSLVPSPPHSTTGWMDRLATDLEANDFIREIAWKGHDFQHNGTSRDKFSRLLSSKKCQSLRLCDCRLGPNEILLLAKLLAFQKESLHDLELFHCHFTCDKHAAAMLDGLVLHNFVLQRLSLSFNHGLNEESLQSLIHLLQGQRLPRLQALQVNRNLGLFRDPKLQEQLFDTLCFHNDSILHLQIGIEDAQNNDYDLPHLRKRAHQLQMCRLRNRRNERVRRLLKDTQFGGSPCGLWAVGFGALAQSHKSLLPPPKAQGGDNFLGVSGLYLAISTLGPKLAEHVSTSL